jgi:hypothetical protein
MRKAILAGTLAVATLVVSGALRGVPLHAWAMMDDDDDRVTNLRALWHFENFLQLAAPPQVTAAQLTPDSTENGNTGNVIDGGGEAHDLGKFDDGVTLTSTGYVEAGHNPTLEPKFVTAELWVKASAATAGANAFLLSKGIQTPCTVASAAAASYSVNRNAAGDLVFRVFNGTTSFASPAILAASVFPAAQTFHHVAGTFDGASVKIYLDGVQQDGGTAVTAGFTINYNLPGGRDLYLGRFNAPAPCTNPFTGTLDETRIWGRALSAAELLVSADMGLQTVGATGGFPPHNIGVKRDASDVYTKEWEISSNAASIKVHFNIVTENPATVITPLGIVVTKTKNALAGSAVNPGLLAGKGYVITVTRGDVTDDSEVRFEAELTDGAELEGRIRIKPLP